MTVGWIDASAGASGDMLLGALVDAGVPLAVLQQPIDALGVGVTLRSEPVVRSGLGATKVDVDVPAPQTLRHLPDVVELLQLLPQPLRTQAVEVFTRLAEAEAAVHQSSIDDVHFHEVGALDCVADIVGTLAGFAHLGVERIHCCPVGLGSGHANTQHGRIPVPVPAVLELLAGAPTLAGPAPFESTTPTGAALLVTLVDQWTPMPAMVVSATGIGAGSKDAAGHPNIVRIVTGDSAAVPSAAPATEWVQIEANIDDIDPRLIPVAIDELLGAGAADAWATPMLMKKGRPAFTLSALCRADASAVVRTAFFAHTTTIGLRERSVAKWELDRQMASVEVDGQSVGVKLAFDDGRLINVSVEWDEVLVAAKVLGRSAKSVEVDAKAKAFDSYRLAV